MVEGEERAERETIGSVENEVDIVAVTELNFQYPEAKGRTCQSGLSPLFIILHNGTVILYLPHRGRKEHCSSRTSSIVLIIFSPLLVSLAKSIG